MADCVDARPACQNRSAKPFERDCGCFVEIADVACLPPASAAVRSEVDCGLVTDAVNRS